ncbi:MAG: amidohydrolase family protein, partial [Dehalococcoidia bacterium]|nr:amidohydrolase family protein [Dehalococcoidia bacterium]
GFPFFGLMPEVARILEEGRLLVDTAATSYLYQPEVFRRGIELIGTRNIAWGSDYPLRSQSVDLGQARDALRTDGEINAILGGNAARFLGLEG